MAKAKKQPANIFSEESDLATDNPVEIVTNESQFPDLDEPVAEETHRVVRTWKKKVPVESVNNVDVIEIEAEPAAPPRPPDPIEELLKEIGVSPQQWSMTVHRLPNYERDGNCSPTAKKIICATLPFDANYAETIQAKFARPSKANDFLVAVRCGNRIHSYLPVVQVEYVPPDNGADDPAQANHVGSTSGEARDPFVELEKALRMVKRMNDALGVSQTIPPPAPPPEPKITTELALLHLAKEDPEMLARQRDKIFGRDNPDSEPESIWAPIVKELLPTVPVLAQGVLLWLGGQANMAQPLPQAPNAPPAPPEPPQMPSPPPRTPTVVVLENLIAAVANNANVKEFAQFLERIEQSTPDVGTFLNFLIELTPDQVLEFIVSFYPQAAPVTQLVHARNWIALLQKEMREEEAAGPSGEGTP